MTALILIALLRANFAAAVAILLILGLRRPIRCRFGALAAYSLWWIAPLCAIASLLPGHAPVQALAPATTVALAATRAAEPLVRQTPVLPTILAGVWLIGALAALALLIIRQWRFMSALGRLSPSPIAPDLLITQRRDVGPAVIGALRPRIVVPVDFERRFQGVARRVVLAHERVHLKRGDATINALAATFRCLCWFNPLVHLAVRRMRVDQEIACDEAVVARYPDDRRVYAQALLDTLLVSHGAPLGCHWQAVGLHPLKERVAMLQASSAPPARKVSGAVLVASIALASAGAVWAGNARPPASAVTQPDWKVRPNSADLTWAYPAEAAKAGREGMAAIDCRVSVEGRLENCTVKREAPQGMGFGRAALDLSADFRLAPATRDGRPIGGGRVTIPIRFSTSGNGKGIGQRHAAQP